jgi:hypothetical protein
MTEVRDQTSPDLRANRRREIFKVARGSKLTGLRGKWAGEPRPSTPADTKPASGAEDPTSSRLRIRLGSTVEDEFNAAETRKERRYSEPND